MPTLHPCAVLVAWAALAVAGQLLAGPPLLAFLGLCIAAAWGFARARALRLLRRSRYLLLALVVIFVVFTPGTRVFVEPAWLVLSREGLALAAVHGARLLCVLMLVALLLERLAPAELVLGLVVLAAPLRRIGLDPSRLAVRLMLVLEMAAERRVADWREWLREADDEAPGGSVIRLPARRFGALDGVIVSACCGLGVLWMLSGA